MWCVPGCREFVHSRHQCGHCSSCSCWWLVTFFSLSSSSLLAAAHPVTSTGMVFHFTTTTYSLVKWTSFQVFTVAFVVGIYKCFQAGSQGIFVLNNMTVLWDQTQDLCFEIKLEISSLELLPALCLGPITLRGMLTQRNLDLTHQGVEDWRLKNMKRQAFLVWFHWWKDTIFTFSVKDITWQCGEGVIFSRWKNRPFYLNNLQETEILKFKEYVTEIGLAVFIFLKYHIWRYRFKNQMRFSGNNRWQNLCFTQSHYPSETYLQGKVA